MSDDDGIQTRSKERQVLRGLSIMEQVPLTGFKVPPSSLGFRRISVVPWWWKKFMPLITGYLILVLLSDFTASR